MDPRLWLATETLFAVGAGLMAASHRLRVAAPQRRAADWTKYALYLVLIHGLLVSASLGRLYAAALLAAVVAGGAIELHAERTALPRALRGPATIALAVALAHALRGPEATWAPAFALLVLLVAATDAFAQLTGRLCGSHHPFPRLSPEKTLEGLAGGLVAALSVALLCGFLAPRLGAAQRLLVGIVTAAAAVGGDLFFSAIKRRARIKDFSTRLPGHGGILDRFDSLVLATPVYTWTLVLIEGSTGG